jgi:hypothetical protein
MDIDQSLLPPNVDHFRIPENENGKLKCIFHRNIIVILFE